MAPPPGIVNTVFRNDGQPHPITGSPAPAWAPLAVATENLKATQGLSIALSPWNGTKPSSEGIGITPGWPLSTSTTIAISTL